MKRELINDIFMLFISVILSLCLYIFNGFGETLNKLQTSVDSLNLNIAVTGQKIISQNKEIESLVKRMEKIESLYDK